MHENLAKTDGPVLVVGAGRALGLAIVEELRAQGLPAIATMRRRRTDMETRINAAGAQLRTLDITDSRAFADLAAESSSLILLPELPFSVTALLNAGLPSHKRCVLFSSHNASVDFTTPIYDRFRAAEAELQASPLAWTILRPTMIYGFPDDRNISRLVATFKKLPVVFLPGRGLARQQPVYYRDLAKVAVAVLGADGTCRQILDIGGPEKLSLKDVYRLAANGKPVISLPLGPLVWLAKTTASLGLPFPLSTAQLARIGVDRVVRPPDGLPEEHWPKTPLATVVKKILENAK